VKSQIDVLVLPADGPLRVETITPDLAAFKALLDGGWLEGIAGEGWTAYCDEEGKLKGLPLNLAATELAHAHGWPIGDVLCGPVVFMGPTDREGEDTAVPEFLLDAARAAAGGGWEPGDDGPRPSTVYGY
jgi:hypothetical protein